MFGNAYLGKRHPFLSCEEEQSDIEVFRFLTIPSLHGQNPILLPSVVLPSKAPVWLFDRPQSDRAKLPESTVHNRIVSTPSAPNLHLAWARVNGLKTSSSFHGAPEKPSEMN
jgi:hypothetical protein